MENWFDIVEPHEDIKEKRFSESVFAADIGDVAARNAPPDYNDPFVFCKKTYFTDGITNLLTLVTRRLSQGEGPGIVEIQTPFGGGKTHSLIAVYHYLKNGEKIAKLLPSGLKPISASVAVIEGTHLNPVEGRKMNGITIRTLWGEISYQLGGKDGYAKFKENDKKQVAPGKDKLKNFLETKQPFIILIDETLEYITKALDVEIVRGTLGGQTYAFLEELTGAVNSVPKGMLILTLPSSELEDFTKKQEDGLGTLNKIFGRVETIETPVKGEEIYSIIRKRLFQGLKDQSKKEDVIHNYFEFYRHNKGDVPSKARGLEFRTKMELAYPFHPDTIDILYEKWGTFSSFQRTRGVLRLLANVVGDLYQKQKNIDMILPCDMNLNAPRIRREFIKHLGNEYESIIGSDIAGHEAKAQIINGEHPEWKHLAERITTSIFLHSFTAEEKEKGVNLSYIKLATIRPDTTPSMVTDILHERLSKELWYLYEKDSRYYFSRIPNPIRIKEYKKDLLKDDPKVEKELESLLNNNVGTALRSYVWPENSNELPDNQELKLVVTHHEFDENKINEWTEKKGDNFRVYKNTLIFALVDVGSYAHLKDQIIEYLAWEEIVDEVESGERETLKDKLSDFKERVDDIKDDFSYNLRKTHNRLYVRNKILSLGIPSVGKENLSTWYRRELESQEEIVTRLHYRKIIKKYMKENKELSTKTILEQFYKDPSWPMLPSKDVLRKTLAKAVSDGALGIITKVDREIVEKSFRFGDEIQVGDITFDEEEYVLSKEYCKDITCGVCGTLLVDNKCPNLCPRCGTHLIDGVCPKCTGKDICNVCGASLVDGKCPNICDVCGEHFVDGKCPNLCPRCGTHLEEKTCPQCGWPKGVKKYRHVMLEIEDIEASKIADLNRGVFMPISREIGGFKFNIRIKIENDEGIDKKIIDETVEQTISQIGGKIKKKETR